MDDWKHSIKWKALLSEIRNEQCVLVIGPDLVQYPNHQTLFQLLCEAIQQDDDYRQQVDLDKQYAFEHEELLQLQPDGYDTDLFNFLEDFYAQRNEFDAPFAKIAQLPFHLVISLLPDERLAKTVGEVVPEAQFGYYPVKDAPQAIGKPTKAQPLVYNILGTLGVLDTVVTFDHLFSYLQGILGTRPLPLPLADTLKRARSFVFLGVRFEKWYMQVLLRVFLAENENKRPLKYSLLKAEQNSGACTFIARRLALDFLSIEPLDFLDELYKQCTEADLLRKPPKKTKKRIFVSYSHQDKAVVMRLVDELLQLPQTDIVFDEVSMSAGDKIRLFMQQVAEMDGVIVVVSAHSLRSPFVGRELAICLEKGVRLIPCHVDKRFLDKDIVEELKAYASTEILEINRYMNERIQKDTNDEMPDLVQEQKLWQEYRKKLPELVAHLQGSKSIALGENDFEKGIQDVKRTI